MPTEKPNFPPTARRNYQEQPAGKAYEKKLAKKLPFLCRLGKSPFRAMLFFHPRSQLFVVFYTTFIGNKKFRLHGHV